MTQIKILVNNIQDVTHRAAAETELNVYLKTGWKVHETHQHMDTEKGSLMLTTIITKEGDEKTENSKQEAVKPKENSATKTDQQNNVKEVKEEKEETSETPKGFKIKEKKEDKESSEEEKETKESGENVTAEVEEFDPEEKKS